MTPNGGPFPNPLPDFLVAAEISWQVDIWRQLRNARDAAGLRYLGTIDGRNYVVTRLVAEIAENYYELMALDKQLETLDRTIALQEQSLEIAKAQEGGSPRHRAGRPAFPGRSSKESKPKADHQAGDHRGREPHQLPLPVATRSLSNATPRGSSICNCTR